MSNYLSVNQIYNEISELVNIENKTIGIRSVDKLEKTLKSLKKRIKRYPNSIEDVAVTQKPPIYDSGKIVSPKTLENLDIAEKNLDQATLNLLNTLAADVIKGIELHLEYLKSIQNQFGNY